MRVELSEDVFESANPLDLIGLIGISRQGRHDILLAPAFLRDDERDLPRMRWLSELGAAIREQLVHVLEIAADRASRRSPRVPTIRVILGSQSRWDEGALALDDAMDFLRAPLRLLLENKTSDWQFLLAMASLALRKDLESVLARRWVEIEGAGGLGELKKRVGDLIRSAEQGVHRDRLRTWVMFDRDADVEDPREASRESRDVAQACQNAALQRPWALPSLQLGRRSIENYLPLEALGHRRPGQTKALKRLRESHSIESFAYSMKQGLSKDASTLDGTARNSLFQQWRGTNDAAVLSGLVPYSALPPAWQALPSDLQAELLFGFGNAIGDEFSQCRNEADWDDWFMREYGRGPSGQPQPHDVINEILELI